MKREILFRGKRIDNGQWVEGSLVECQNFKGVKFYQIDNGKMNEHRVYEVHPDTVEIKTDNGEFKNLKEVKIG